MTDPGVVDRAIRFALNAVGARNLEPHPADAFYDRPPSIPGTPGTVLKAEPGRFYVEPLKLIPAPARVQRIMFTTTDRHQLPVAVTRTVP